jgi:creatinine amidohydrolase
MDANELYDPEFRKLIKEKKPTIIIPVGSLEQHGAHLPITTDSDIVTEIASRLAKKCGFIVFPTISYGISYEHEPLFHSSIPEKVLLQTILNLLKGLFTYDVVSVIFLNGHHGNVQALDKLLRLINPGMKEIKSNLRVMEDQHSKKRGTYWTGNVNTRVYSYWEHMKHKFDHAGFVETSIMLAISDKVKMKKAKKGLMVENLSKLEQSTINKLSTQRGGFPQVAKNGVWGDPTSATKKDGEKFLAEIVRNLAKECQT